MGWDKKETQRLCTSATTITRQCRSPRGTCGHTAVDAHCADSAGDRLFSCSSPEMNWLVVALCPRLCIGNLEVDRCPKTWQGEMREVEVTQKVTERIFVTVSRAILTPIMLSVLE